MRSYLNSGELLILYCTTDRTKHNLWFFYWMYFCLLGINFNHVVLSVRYLVWDNYLQSVLCPVPKMLNLTELISIAWFHENLSYLHDDVNHIEIASFMITNYSVLHSITIYLNLRLIVFFTICQPVWVVFKW